MPEPESASTTATPQANPLHDQLPKDDKGRPTEMPMGIHTGMLQSLGNNMYTSIGKSLAEFVANAFDADAKEVRITLPFEQIDDARTEIRQKAKGGPGIQDTDHLNALLPPDIKIVIRDNGHGMSPWDFVDKFLIINRNRRADSDKSESNLRQVMGRKGLGKLAGFGAADTVTVKSKRANEPYSTTLMLNYSQIKEKESISQVKLTPQYTDDADLAAKWTEIELSGLRCDAVKAKSETVEKTLARAFAILGEDFKIFLNDTTIQEESAEFEFFYPQTRDEKGFAADTVDVDGMFTCPIKYFVRFRARATDTADTSTEPSAEASAAPPTGMPPTPAPAEAGPQKKPLRGSLPAGMRGARIYCNGRLAHGPSMLDLETGMHNFHSQSYMECVVHADALDRQKIADFIGTNRAELKRDNEIVEALIEKVTSLMRDALKEHAKFRENKAEKQMENDPKTQAYLGILEGMSTRVTEPARKILKLLATEDGVNSELYTNVAPLVVRSMNAGEVLTNLIKLGADPKSITVVAHELLELGRIETSDVLKVYRGKRDGIVALEELKIRGELDRQGKQFEKELHSLLKTHPWLIEPHFSRWLTSDMSLGTVSKKLDQVLEIDTSIPEDKVNENDDKRPDLVYVAVNPGHVGEVIVVELKSPGLDLNADHLQQLEYYLARVEQVIHTDHGVKPRVRGYLIGKMPAANTQAAGGITLLSRIAKSGPETNWGVISIAELLERSKRAHLECIEALAAEEQRLDADLG